MANPLFNRFGGGYQNSINNNSSNVGNGGLLGILRQYRQLQRDPGAILDILFQHGKINQQQYNELQPMRNNPQQIVNYLTQHGNANQINYAQQIANSATNQLRQ